MSYVISKPFCIRIEFALFLSPGRFFASYTLKVALAHVLLNFDVDFLDSNRSGRPTKFWFQAIAFPDIKTELILSKRT